MELNEKKSNIVKTYLNDESRTFKLKENVVGILDPKKENLQPSLTQPNIKGQIRVTVFQKNRDFLTLKRTKTLSMNFVNEFNSSKFKEIKRTSSFGMKLSEVHPIISHSVNSKKLRDITETKEYKDIYTANLRLYSSIIAKVSGIIVILWINELIKEFYFLNFLL